MLVIEDQKYFDEIIAFAKDIGLYEESIAGRDDGRQYLKRSLDRLDDFTREDANGELVARVVVYPDFAPRSFGFRVQRRDEHGAWRSTLVGGVIFHGAHDGGGNGMAPTFSVSLTPAVGWSIHT